MGIRITVGGHPFQAIDYTVTEASSPLAAGDSSGQVGTIEFTLQPVDPDLGAMHPGWKLIQTFGAQHFIDAPIRLTDSRRGFTVGTVNSTGRTDSGALTFTCVSRLDELNVYGVQAQPYIGTLGGAFEYYLSLADVATDFFIDEAIRNRPVVFPGWSGELWFRLKQVAAAQDCDISLVSGVILLRPVRTRVATRGRDIQRSQDTSVQTLAQSVEVYKYSNRVISNELVYPPGGWVEGTEILNVNAGETAEYTLELSASVSSIVQPTMTTFVSPTSSNASVYTIVASDGLPVSPTMWADRGGRVSVTINPDTTSLTVHLRGARNIPTAAGEASTNFQLALASDTTGNRYSTLRILGTGVGFNKEKVAIRTGVPASKTATEVGVTIDNPFISTTNDLYRAGTRAAKNFAGQVPNLTGSVVSINRRGDSGVANYPKYGEVEDALKSQLGGTPTYAAVQSFYATTVSPPTYGTIRDYWFEFVRSAFENQLFGNVNGARIWDQSTRRWYRIRTGSLVLDRINFSAEDDLTHADAEEFHLERTYADLQAIFSGMTYKQMELAGLYGGA